MDILAALSPAKPAPALPFGATDSADPEAGQLFQAILGELGATDGATSATPGLIAAGQSSPLLRQAAQAAGALRPDGAIDLGILARTLRQDIGALLGGEADAASVQLTDGALVDPSALVAETTLAPVTGDAPAADGEPVVLDPAIALPTPSPAQPVGAMTAAAVPAQPMAAPVPTTGAESADAEAAPADGAMIDAEQVAAVAPSQTKGKAGKAKDASGAPATPTGMEKAASAQPVPGDAPDSKTGAEPAELAKAGKAVDAQAPVAKAGEAAPKDKAGRTEAARSEEAPVVDDGAEVVAGESAEADEPLATAADRPARKPAKPDQEIGRGSDGKAMAAIAANPSTADDEAVAAALARREARMAQDAEAADRRRAVPAADAPIADAAAQPSAPKPAAAQPQGQTMGLAERVAVAAPTAGGDPGHDRNPDRQSDRCATADIAQTATTTAEGAKSGGTDFVQHLAAAKPLRGGAHAVPPAPHQVAVHIQRAGQDGLDRVSIQLRPVELGRIDVRMEFGNDGVMRARIVAENPQTLELLQRDARALEKALQDVGVRTEQGSLSFSLRDDGRSAHQQQDRPGKGRGTAFTLDGEAIANDTQTDRPVRLPAAGRVDVRV